MFFSALAVIVVVALAAVLGPKGPTRPARSDAGRGQSAAGMALSVAVCPALAQPAGGRNVHHAGLSGDLDRGLLLVPLVSNRGERAPSRRPVAVLAVVMIYTVLGVLTYEGRLPLVAGDDRLERRPGPDSTWSKTARPWN